MFDTILKSFAPRAVQDIITAIAGYLATQGFITHDQEQSFVGAAFFLAMLIVNHFIAQTRKGNAAVAGAASTGVILTPDVVANAKLAGKTP